MNGINSETPQISTGLNLDDFKLTPMQSLWIEDYLKHFNATQAARYAGYSDPANSGRDNKIALKVYIDAYFAKTHMSPAEIAARFVQMATFDPTQYIRADGSLDLDGIRDDGLGWVISEISSKTVKDIDGNPETIYTVKFHSQFNALQVLGRYIGMDKSMTLNVVNVINKGYADVSPDDWDAPQLEDENE